MIYTRRGMTRPVVERKRPKSRPVGDFDESDDFLNRAEFGVLWANIRHERPHFGSSAMQPRGENSLFLGKYRIAATGPRRTRATI